MKSVHLVVPLALLLAAATLAPAFEAEPLAHILGEAWETGGFPPSAPGDRLEAVGVVTESSDPLPWTRTGSSITWHIENLISLSETVYATHRVVEYGGGTISVYDDGPFMNHAYGVFPPNSSAPASFTDGPSLELRGSFDQFTLVYDPASMNGSFTGRITFTGGAVMSEVAGTDGWALGSQIRGFSPAGYDFQVNGGVLYVQNPTAVQTASWSGIKSMYR